MKRSSVVTLVLTLVGLGAAGGGLAWFAMSAGGAPAGGLPPDFEPAEAVNVVEARVEPWQPMADLMGTVIARRSVTVRNELVGTVTFVGFDSGSIVEAGQVVLKQDDRVDRAALEAARAAVRVAEASIVQADSRIVLAEAEWERMSSALAGRAVVDLELTRSRAALDSARAERAKWVADADQARARVAEIEARISKLTITAPFRARAGMRNVHEGQFLSEGDDVVVLQELADSIFLDFAVPQEYALRVTPGTSVMATGELLGPDPVRIDVVAVDATVNYDTRNLRVRAVVENPRGTLVPGMFVQVRVPVEESRRYVVVPSMAVRRAAFGNSVYVIEPEASGDAARARQRFVTLGPAVGEDVIVLEGLKEGERVAGAGSFKLRDGAKVMIGPSSGAPGGEGAAAGGGGGASKGG
ncbi:MAG: efflux RND transporter periplasmic adaptor subunit [Phycisphaerales bacterium]